MRARVLDGDDDVVLVARAEPHQRAPDNRVWSPGTG